MTWCPQKVRNSSFSTIIWKYTWNQSSLDVCGVPKKVIPHLYHLMGCYISIKIRKSVSHTKLGSNTACHPGCTSICYRKWLCPREWVFWPHNNFLFVCWPWFDQPNNALITEPPLEIREHTRGWSLPKWITDDGARVKNPSDSLICLNDPFACK